MDFKTLSGVVQSIITTIQQTAVGSVRSINKNTFSTTVKNFPKTQTIKGSVTVTNQKKLEKEIKENRKIHKEVFKFLKKLKFPTSIEVSNFPKFPKFPEFPKEFKVSNFPEPLPFPKNIRVSNQPTKELKEVASTASAIEKAIKGLKLNPKINVEAPKMPAVNVPEPRVMVTQQEVDYKKIASLIPKGEKIDYDKLATTISKQLAEMVVTIGSGGGSGRGNPYLGRDGKPARALVDDKGRVITSPDYFLADKAKVGDVTYTGNENSEGDWYMFKLDGDAIRYASNKNNTGYKDYAEAWSDKENLDYDYPSNVDF